MRVLAGCQSGSTGYPYVFGALKTALLHTNYPGSVGNLCSSADASL